MINGGENVGSQPSDAYAIAQKHGLATWAALPYDGNYRAWSVDPSVWRDAIFARADQTGKVLDVDADAGLGQLKQLLVNGYVLNFATYINSWQWKAIGNDHSAIREDLSQMLIQEGLWPVVAQDGTEGLELARTLHPDLIKALP